MYVCVCVNSVVAHRCIYRAMQQRVGNTRAARSILVLGTTKCLPDRRAYKCARRHSQNAWNYGKWRGEKKPIAGSLPFALRKIDRVAYALAKKARGKYCTGYSEYVLPSICVLGAVFPVPKLRALILGREK